MEGLIANENVKQEERRNYEVAEVSHKTLFVLVWDKMTYAFQDELMGGIEKDMSDPKVG